MGWKHEHDTMVTFQAQVKQQAVDQLTHTKQVEADHQTLLENTKNDYEKRLADVNDYWTKRLLHTPTDSKPVPVPGTTPIRPDGAAPDPLPDTDKLIVDCAATTVQLEALQTWVMTEILQK